MDINNTINMGKSDWSDVFVSAFVLIALALMTISAWIKVINAVSTKKFGEGDPNDPSLLPYIGLAIFVTILTIFVLFMIQQFSGINLERQISVPDLASID
jgi:uncharacterized membrane protein YidH (DUF202 family)